jgi:hypothetical protein
MHRDTSQSFIGPFSLSHVCVYSIIIIFFFMFMQWHGWVVGWLGQSVEQGWGRWAAASFYFQCISHRIAIISISCPCLSLPATMELGWGGYVRESGASADGWRSLLQGSFWAWRYGYRYGLA